MQEFKIHIALLEHLFSSYYEKQMISYDEDVCQWYSRYLGRYMDLKELEELFYEITTDLFNYYHECNEEMENEDY